LLESNIRQFLQGWYVAQGISAQVVQEDELVPITEVLS
jgi:hypothetical protein